MYLLSPRHPKYSLRYIKKKKIEHFSVYYALVKGGGEKE